MVESHNPITRTILESKKSSIEMSNPLTDKDAKSKKLSQILGILSLTLIFLFSTCLLILTMLGYINEPSTIPVILVILSFIPCIAFLVSVKEQKQK